MLVATGAVSACSTFSKSEKTVVGSAGSAQGQWQGRAFVKNTKKNKSGSIDLEILAREPDRLRLDATASFGIHLASVALNGDRAQILLAREKRFLERKADAQTMTRLVPVRLDPKALLALLFDRPLAEQPGWSCSDGAADVVRSCLQSEANVRVVQKPTTDGSRRFEIFAPDAQVDLVLREAKAKVEFNESAFELKAPSGYRLD